MIPSQATPRRLGTIQPFSVTGAGGGPRILRSILSDPPVDVVSVCTAPKAGAGLPGLREVHLPSRPRFGRLESTRINRVLGAVELISQPFFRRRLTRLLADEEVSAIHVVPHGADIGAVRRVADDLGVPVFLDVHDDLGYVLRRRIEARNALRELGALWREATQRFVISPQMGIEMSRRYGERPFSMVTDGLSDIATETRSLSASGPVVIYFMGAAHLSYRANFEALFAGASIWQQRTGRPVRIVVRGGLPPGVDLSPGVEVDTRPWASQDAILDDLSEAGLLYLPLPFGQEHERFVRFSLSTKLVTYVGSGVPILYHGPSRAAAAELLGKADAAVLSDTLAPEDIAAALARIEANGQSVSEAAVDLARREFSLDGIRDRFWSTIAS